MVTGVSLQTQLSHHGRSLRGPQTKPWGQMHMLTRDAGGRPTEEQQGAVRVPQRQQGAHGSP